MDDLTTPLGLKNSGGRRLRLPVGAIAAILAVTMLAGAGLWMAVVNDPLGGEPVVRVPIETAAVGVNRGEIATVGVKSGTGALLPPLAGTEAAPPVSAAAVASVEVGAPGDAAPEVRPSIEADPALVESSPWGPLPKIGADGRRPLDVYARPVPGTVGAAPKIAVIVGDLGLSQTATQEAIRVLPPAVTLAFAPYGASLDRWTMRARQEGHELLLQIPLEPFDYPDNDPGPNTLLTANDAEKNLADLHTLMARLSSYVGILNYMGGKFTADAAALDPVIGDVAARGLIYVDDGSSARSVAAAVAGKRRAAFARADVAIDASAGPEEMTGRLAQLEQIARGRGIAVGTAGARPATLKAVSEWAKGLDARGITLVPISAARQKG